MKQKLTGIAILSANRKENEQVEISWSYMAYDEYVIDNISYQIAYRITDLSGFTLSNEQLQNHLVLYLGRNKEYIFNSNDVILTADDQTILEFIKQGTLRQLQLL